MRNLSKNQIKKIKDFIFRNGRLLERKLFSFFFENGNKDEVIKAIVAYQNLDGGFGNGIELDLLCPDSTAIGTETAMYIFDLLEISENDIIDELVKWIINTQNDQGYINHPPENLDSYPHQPWWKNPDNKRILILAAILNKWGLKHNEFFNKVREFYLKTHVPEEIQIYDYPYFVYLKYCNQDENDKKNLIDFLKKLPTFLEENANHNPLFSRYWFYFIDDVKDEIIEREIERFISAIQEDGGLKIAFENLPWWRPIFTLDGLMIAKINGIIEF